MLLFFFLWNFEQAFGFGPERKSLWSKCIGEICVMVVYIKIKIIFLRLIFELTQFMQIIKRRYV